MVPCVKCGGTGIDPETGDPCNTCGGTGQIEAPTEWARLRYDISKLPTVTQANAKFEELQTDIDDLKTGIQAIWNKVKDL